MKIIIAPDAFKGSLTASEVSRIIAHEISKHDPGMEVVIKPMADGGEGTAEALLVARKGEWITREVMGPLPEMKVKASFAWFEQDKEAVVEMAKASGIELLSGSQLNPLKTTTYGTGQLIKAAVEYGAEKILLAVGGSSTVDGGVGAASALGWRFSDIDGKDIPLGGAGLENITMISGPVVWDVPQVTVLSDVNNPLCGVQGAARVFGPQKGASPEMVEKLEKNLFHLAYLVKTQLSKDIADLPGAGAAGGLAAGAVAFMNARIVSGIEHIIMESRLVEEASNADWIITGEGSFDKQSLMGKTVAGIAKVAKCKQVKVAVIAGQVNVQSDQLKESGIHAAISCMREGTSLDSAMSKSKQLLRTSVKSFVEEYLC